MYTAVNKSYNKDQISIHEIVSKENEMESNADVMTQATIPIEQECLIAHFTSYYGGSTLSCDCISFQQERMYVYFERENHIYISCIWVSLNNFSITLLAYVLLNLFINFLVGIMSLLRWEQAEVYRAVLFPFSGLESHPHVVLMY